MKNFIIGLLTGLVSGFVAFAAVLNTDLKTWSKLLKIMDKKAQWLRLLGLYIFSNKALERRMK